MTYCSVGGASESTPVLPRALPPGPGCGAVSPGGGCVVDLLSSRRGNAPVVPAGFASSGAGWSTSRFGATLACTTGSCELRVDFPGTICDDTALGASLL